LPVAVTVRLKFVPSITVVEALGWVWMTGAAGLGVTTVEASWPFHLSLGISYTIVPREPTEMGMLPVLLLTVRLVSSVFKSPLQANVPLPTLLKTRVPVPAVSRVLLTITMTESF
jgi:hypothetical protein